MKRGNEKTRNNSCVTLKNVKPEKNQDFIEWVNSHGINSILKVWGELDGYWCSWEIGYADCHKGVDDIAILAIKPNNGKWKENEFLQQYPWIQYEIDESLFKVHMPNGSTQSLHNWLNH